MKKKCSSIVLSSSSSPFNQLLLMKNREKEKNVKRAISCKQSEILACQKGKRKLIVPDSRAQGMIKTDKSWLDQFLRNSDCLFLFMGVNWKEERGGNKMNSSIF